MLKKNILTYLYVDMDVNDVTIDTVCTMAESQQMQRVGALRSWMNRAKHLHLKFRIVQFDGKSLTVYLRHER